MTSLYVHIPFCQSKCSYCAFYSEDISKHDTAALTGAIIDHINDYDLSDIQTVYIGGGSPSSLPQARLFKLIEHISNNCPREIEFTTEVNPSQVNSKLLQGLVGRGVNRLSIGAQSFNDDELKFLGRLHTANQIQTAFDQARNAGLKNISLDLIFAIPGSTLQSFEFSLDKAISLNPDHISAYSLTIEPQTPIYHAVKSGKIIRVGEETDRRMYEMAIDKLNVAGFGQYEISNFAKPGYECKHNLACWTNDPYIGIGPAAASYYKGRRYTNICDIKAYTTAIQNSLLVATEIHTPDKKEKAHETAVLNLRTRSGINLADFKQRTGYDAMELFKEPITQHLKQGMLELDETKNTISLTKKALPIADTIICDFT